jgi:hypothetical protein
VHRRRRWCCPVIRALGEDTGHFDADGDVGVVADGGRVDDEDEQHDLGRGIVLLEERVGVDVADGGIGGPLGEVLGRGGSGKRVV